MSISASIFAAFETSCGGYSADRVLVDPNLNNRFIEACRNLGLTDPEFTLNTRLLNLRKSGGRKGKKTAKKSSFSNESEYRFASEVAIRFLERRDQISTDNILADPIRAAEFDRIAAELAPGYLPVQYRWAALNLRKLRQLVPELLSRVKPSVASETVAVSKLDLKSLPTTQGLYLFYNSKNALYAGEATNLRLRLEKHLDHSDNKDFARWLWVQGPETLHLEWHVLDATTETRVRKALEAELISSRQPLFNVQAKAPRKPKK